VTPLGLVVAGFLLVLLDFRVAGFDFLPDSVGWLATVLGLVRLRERSGWFGVALAAAVVGVLVGVPVQFAEPEGPLLALSSVVETCLVFAVCSGVAEAVATDERVRRTAHLIRWLDLGLVVLLTGLAVLAPEPASILVLGVATLAVAVWFLVFVASVRQRPELQPGLVVTA
jgi:hypothetical protein